MKKNCKNSLIKLYQYDVGNILTQLLYFFVPSKFRILFKLIIPLYIMVAIGYDRYHINEIA